MKKETMLQFKLLFESKREEILKEDPILNDAILHCSEGRSDQLDQATLDVEQAMRMRLRNRNTLYLRKIAEALHRIEEGTFGECEDCGEDIEVKRLEARPTASLCVGCKEDQERKEILTASGREHKSLGMLY